MFDKILANANSCFCCVIWWKSEKYYYVYQYIEFNHLFYNNVKLLSIRQKGSSLREVEGQWKM